MKKLESFLPRMLPWCPAAPEPLVYQALADSAIQFCEETHIVRYITDPITVIAHVADYDIELPQHTELSRILRVWYGDGAYDEPKSRPTNWLMTFEDQIKIVPTPTTRETGPLFIEVATKPVRSATMIDNTLYDDWIEGVVGGAVQRVCAIPDQPWSNDLNAQKGAAAYALWRGKALYEGTKMRVRRDTVVRARPFA